MFYIEQYRDPFQFQPSYAYDMRIPGSSYYAYNEILPPAFTLTSEKGFEFTSFYKSYLNSFYDEPLLKLLTRYSSHMYLSMPGFIQPSYGMGFNTIGMAKVDFGYNSAF